MCKLVRLLLGLCLLPWPFTLLLPVSRAQQPSSSQEPPALDNPVIDDADEDEIVPYLQSGVALKYDHDIYDPITPDNIVRLAWFQTYGELQRFGTSIELPWVNFDNGPAVPAATSSVT